MSDLYLEQEEQTSPSEHSASDEEEEALRALLAKMEADELAAEEAAKLALREICSCGFFTCGAIGRFGHPLPVFKEDIEPLWPQGSRDKRALELKGGGR